MKKWFEGFKKFLGIQPKINLHNEGLTVANTSLVSSSNDEEMWINTKKYKEIKEEFFTKLTINNTDSEEEINEKIIVSYELNKKIAEFKIVVDKNKTISSSFFQISEEGEFKNLCESFFKYLLVDESHSESDKAIKINELWELQQVIDKNFWLIYNENSDTSSSQSSVSSKDIYYRSNISGDFNEWRSGNRTILYLLGHPSGYLLKEDISSVESSVDTVDNTPVLQFVLESSME